MKHQQIHFLRAIMEGIIFAVYSVGKTLEELVGKIEVINAGGGFAKSRFWVQMLADVFGKKVVINNSLESSSLGAAMVGFKALGIYQDIEHLQESIEIVEEFIPNHENHLKYKKAFQIFEMLYSNLKETFRMI
jgi:gluconokinase